MRRSQAASGHASRGTMAVFVVFLVAGTLLLPLTTHPWFVLHPDSAMYIACAKSMIRGEGYSFLGSAFTLRPPGLSALLAPLIRWRGVDTHAMNLLIGWFGVLSAALVFLTASKEARLIPSVALAVMIWLNPSFQRLDNMELADMPGLAVFLGAVLVHGWLRKAPSPRRQLLLGVLLAAGIYLRTVYALMPAAVVLADLAEWAGNERRRASLMAFVRRRFLYAILAAVPLVLPWAVRNQRLANDTPSDQTVIHGYLVGILHTRPGDPRSETVGIRDLVSRVARNNRIIQNAFHQRRMDRPDSSSGGVSVLFVVVTAATLYYAFVRRSSMDIFFFLYLLVLYGYFGTVPRLTLPVYVVGLLNVLTLAQRLASGWRPAAQAVPVVATVAILALTWHDLCWRCDWRGIERRDRRLRRQSEWIARKAGRMDRLGIFDRHFHYNVFPEQPVYGYEIAYRSGRDPATFDRITRKYGITKIILTGKEPRAFREWVGRVGKPHAGGGRFRIVPLKKVSSG